MILSRRIAAVIVLWVVSLSTAGAQAPEIGGLWPAGGQRGTAAVIHLEGHNLQGAGVLLSGTGVKVDRVEANPAGDGALVKLSISPEAPLGPREMRIWSRSGVSNPGHLWIDVFPERQEVENNDDPAHAQSLGRSAVVIDGRIQVPTDRDVFSILAHAGEMWQFDCLAARLRSRLDPVLELRDESGRLLKLAQSTWENDPRLIYEFTRSGRYLLTVRDTQFLGGPDFVYRVTAGPMPIITGYLPLGQQPGHTAELKLSGYNLGEEAPVLVQAPIPADAAPGEYWVSIVTKTGPAIPAPLIIDEAPVVEAHPGETMELPTLPVCVDGAFSQAAQTRFSFHATPAAHLVFDLLGRRIGSRIDGAIRVLDAGGKEVAANDDAVGKDARLEFAAPTEGTYTIEVRNVEEKLGEDCYYRLAVYPAAPDFRLHLDTDRLQVGTDGTTAIAVTAERLYGFDGPIDVSASDLPAGVVCSGGTIAPGHGSIEITLTAPASTSLGAAVIHLHGTAKVGEKSLVREVTPREQYLPRSIDPGMFTDDSYKRPYRNCELLPLGVVTRAESFALAANVNAVSLAPGEKTEIVVKAVRRAGSKGEIKLDLRGLPDKVTASAASIPVDGTEAHITLTAGADAPAAVNNVIIQGLLDKESQTAPAVRVMVHR